MFSNWRGNSKGQLISKANCQAVNSSKKRTNEFIFTTMRRVFVCFLEEIEDSKKAFRNYLTFRIKAKNLLKISIIDLLFTKYLRINLPIM